MGDGQWNIAALRELLENVLPGDQSFEDYVVDSEFPLIGRRRLLLNARRLVGKFGAPPLILLAMQPG